MGEGGNGELAQYFDLIRRSDVKLRIADIFGILSLAQTEFQFVRWSFVELYSRYVRRLYGYRQCIMVDVRQYLAGNTGIRWKQLAAFIR